mgnify:CR=1 FL=1
MARKGKTCHDIELLTELPELGVAKLFPIIWHDGLWNSKSAYNRLPDEHGGVTRGDLGEGLYFYQFNEVIKGNYGDLDLPFTSRQRAYEINPSLGQGIGAAECD